MVEVYDIETLRECFTYTGLDIQTGKVSQFVVSKYRDDIDALKLHLMKLKGQIGYNNIGFDYPIIHYIMTQLSSLNESERIVELIYGKAQDIINTQDEAKFLHIIPEWRMLIPQLDLFKLNHFDNKAKRTSLKDLEFWMNYENVQDMPIHHHQSITKDDIPLILDYNLNDVNATFKFYQLCRDKIGLRKSLSKQYGLRLINANDAKIGSDIVLDTLSAEMMIEKKDLRLMRTKRNSIALGDLIDDKVSFKSKEFNKLLEQFKSTVITSTKGSIDYSVVYKGFKYEYGLGGIHGCIKGGIYSADDEYCILDADVGSLYPSIAIRLGLYPEHLGQTFVKVYSELLEKRLKAKKEGDKVLNEGLKLSLNSVYGKSSDEKSFLYDPKFTMSITINGQLYLTMLSEMLVNSITNVTILQVNTDGITIKLLKEDVDRYYEICKQWESITGLSLEYAKYRSMIIRDVNNYMAIKEGSNSVKYKGYFEIDKEFHKDTSFKIVQIALSKYFVENIPIKDTIMNHKNIYDFCGRQKFKSDSMGYIHRLEYDENNDPFDNVIKQQKTVRYYISTDGGTFVKLYKDKNKSSFINKGFKVTEFNKYIEKDMKEYNINYSFYVAECMKVINVVEDKQLNLF